MMRHPLLLAGTSVLNTMCFHRPPNEDASQRRLHACATGTLQWHPLTDGLLAVQHQGATAALAHRMVSASTSVTDMCACDSKIGLIKDLSVALLCSSWTTTCLATCRETRRFAAPPVCLTKTKTRDKNQMRGTRKSLGHAQTPNPHGHSLFFLAPKIVNFRSVDELLHDF